MRTHRVCNTTADRNSGQRVESVLCTRTSAAFDKCGTRAFLNRSPENSLHRVLHATAAVKYRRRRRIKTELLLLLLLISLRLVDGFQRNILYIGERFENLSTTTVYDAHRYIMRRLYNNFYFLRILATAITAIVPLVPRFYPPRDLSLSMFLNLSFPISSSTYGLLPVDFSSFASLIRSQRNRIPLESLLFDSLSITGPFIIGILFSKDNNCFLSNHTRPYLTFIYWYR